MKSIFNSTPVCTTAKKKKNWSFRSPDKRNPEMKDYLSVQKVAIVRPPSKGVFSLNGELFSSFAELKNAAKESNFDKLRMGAINVNLQ
jgi:hypothetical protein